MGTIIFNATLAILTFLYVRLLLRRLEPASLRRAAEAASAYRRAMGQEFDVADAERHIRRWTKFSIVSALVIAAAVIVVEVVANL